MTDKLKQANEALDKIEYALSDLRFSGNGYFIDEIAKIREVIGDDTM